MRWQTKQIKKILSIIISIIALLSLIIVSVIIYQKMKIPSKRAIEAIPLEASMILKINNPKAIWDEEISTTDFWTEIRLIERYYDLDNQIHSLDSLIHTDVVTAKVVAENPLYISFHLNKDSQFSMLFLVEIPKEFSNSIGKFLSSIAKSHLLNETMQKDVNIFSNTKEKGYSFYSYKGVFACSNDMDLLKKSANQIQSKLSLLNDSIYARIQSSEGKKSNLILSINYKHLYNSIAPFFYPDVSPILSNINNTKGWSSSDMLFRKDLLLMSGFFAIDQKSYLNTICNSDIHDASFADVLDENTFLLYSISTNDYKGYISKYEQFNRMNNLKVDSLNLLNSDTNVSIENVKKLWKKINPMQIISSATSISDTTAWLLTVRPYDIIIAQNALYDELTSQSKNQSKTDTSKYKDFVLGKLNLAQSARIFSNPFFSNIDIQYFAVGQNFIHFASSKKHLTKIIDRISDSKTLSNSYIFKSFCNDINVSSNMLVYLSPFEGKMWIKNKLDTTNSVGKVLNVLSSKTPYIGFKFGKVNNHLLPTTFCWKYLINSVSEIDKKPEDEAGKPKIDNSKNKKLLTKKKDNASKKGLVKKKNDKQKSKSSTTKAKAKK